MTIVVYVQPSSHTDHNDLLQILRQLAAANRIHDPLQPVVRPLHQAQRGQVANEIRAALRALPTAVHGDAGHNQDTSDGLPHTDTLPEFRGTISVGSFFEMSLNKCCTYMLRFKNETMLENGEN